MVLRKTLNTNKQTTDFAIDIFEFAIDSFKFRLDNLEFGIVYLTLR